MDRLRGGALSVAPDEPLAPVPGDSRWGRNVALGYLALVSLAFLLMLTELARGAAGAGTFALSVLTAPWSVLLAPLARALQGHVGELGLRVMGLALAVLCAMLNARILYGMAARTERDVRNSRGGR